MVLREGAAVLTRGPVLPDDGRDELISPEALIGEDLQVVEAVVVDRDPEASVVAEQRPQCLEGPGARPKPLVVIEPVLIMGPPLSRVVWRVDVDAAHSAAQVGQLGQNLYVVALD